MAIAKIQTGDNVKVIAGSYKGTIGVVTEVITVKKKNRTFKRCVVSTIPTIVKYQKANKLYKIEGAMKQTSRPIDMSNVMIVEDGNPTRTKISIDKEGKKVRVSLKTDKPVTKVAIPKSKELKELKETSK
jgi:large subunit ribosomal protein L24